MASLTREQVRRVDKIAIETLGVSGLVLMENAGRGAADAAQKFLREIMAKPIAAARVAVVAGGGNNGGDGFVIARHLSLRGAHVETFLVPPSGKFTGDAAANLKILRNLGHIVHDYGSFNLAALRDPLRGFDLVIDAIGGTGIAGSLRDDMRIAVEEVNASARPVLAVDIPSGLDCDTGQPNGPVVRAQLTVTFVARKIGFDQPGAAEFTGEVIVADIGVPAEACRTP